MLVLSLYWCALSLGVVFCVYVGGVSWITWLPGLITLDLEQQWSLFTI